MILSIFDLNYPNPTDKRDKILSSFTIEDSENPYTYQSIVAKLEQIDMATDN